MVERIADAELVAAALDGDREAFETLVRRHLDDMMSRGEGRKDLSALIEAVERAS